MRKAVLALATALTSAEGSAAEAPSLVWGSQGLSLARLPPILAEPAVARHLGTGLTTTLLLTVEVSGTASFKGGAQASVRYDLWDEIYLVEQLDAKGSAHTTLRTRDELYRWWTSLVVSVSPQGRPASVARARVTLHVLPFSQAEQQDAQEWLLRTLRAAEPPPPSASRPGAGEAPVAPPAPVRDLYGAMLASSIGRRSLINYSWTVPIGDSR
jgi:hypothetical protein